VKRIGVPDQLVEHAKPDEAKAELGLTGSQIAERVREMFFSQQLSAVSG